MFFSASLLSNRHRSGFGVYWLASTIASGKSSTIAKLTKKEILNADVEKACETLVNPPEPLALRLSSGLLLGIARVYLHKWTLFEADVNNVSTALRKALAAIYASTRDGATESLDLTVHQARADAINLPQGPFADLSLSIELDAYEPFQAGVQLDHYLLFGGPAGEGLGPQEMREFEDQVARGVGVELESRQGSMDLEDDEYGDHKRLSSRDLASSQVDRDPYVADPENINLVEGHHPDLYGAHAPLDDDDDLDRLFLGSQAGRHESRARSGSALGGYGDGTGLQDGYGLDDFAGFDVGDGILAGVDPQLDIELGISPRPGSVEGLAAPMDGIDYGPSSDAAMGFEPYLREGYDADAETGGHEGQARRKARRGPRTSAEVEDRMDLDDGQAFPAGDDMDLDREIALGMEVGAGLLDGRDDQIGMQLDVDLDQQLQAAVDGATPDGTPSLRGLQQADLDAINAAAEKHRKKKQSTTKRKSLDDGYNGGDAAASEERHPDDQEAEAPIRPVKKSGRKIKGGALVDSETMLTADELRVMRDSYDENLRQRQEADRKMRREKQEKDRALALVYGVPAWIRAPQLISLWNDNVQLPPFGSKPPDTERESRPAKRARTAASSHDPHADQAARFDDHEQALHLDFGHGMENDFDAPFMGDDGEVGAELGPGADDLEQAALYEDEVGRGRASSLQGASVPGSAIKMPWDFPTADDYLSDVVGGYDGAGPSSATRSISRFSRETPIKVGRAGQRQSSVASPLGDAGMDGHGSDTGAALDFGAGFEGFGQDGVAAALTRDHINFLDWVKGQATDMSDFLFSDLAPLSTTHPAVATGAFARILSLASKGLVNVLQQDEPYGEIHLSIGRHAAQ